MLNNLFSKNLSFSEIMWKKNGIAGQGTDGNMAHARCLLLRHTHVTCFVPLARPLF